MVEKKKKSVSGVVGIIFIALLLILFFAGVFYYSNQMYRTTVLGEQRTEKLAEAIILSKSVSGYWTYDAGLGEINVTITNSYSQPVFVSGGIIVYPDNTYEIIKINDFLGIGESKSYLISVKTKPSVVRFSFIGSKGAALSTDFKEQTTSTGGATINPWERQNLEKIVPSPATTWVGTATIHYPTTLLGNPITITSITGSVAIGTPSDLASKDNNNVTYIPIIQTDFIDLVENNTIIFDDFLTDPLGTRLIPVTGDWRYNAGATTVSERDENSVSEDYAYINLTYYGVSSLPEKSHVLVKIKPKSGRGTYHDILLLQDPTSGQYFYEYSTTISFFSNNQGYASIWKYTTVFTLLSVGSIDDQIRRNTWVISYAFHDAVTETHRLIVSSKNGYGVSIASAVDTVNPITVNYVGIGNYADGETEFDYVYLVKNYNPMYIYVRNVPSGYTVVVKYGADTWTNSTYDPSIPGIKVLFYNNNPDTYLPILDPGTIEIYDGPTLVASYTGKLMGGSVYEYFPTSYMAEFTVDVQVSPSSLATLTGGSVLASLSSNLSSTNLKLYVYNWASSSYELLDTTTGSIHSNYTLSNINNYINGTNYMKLKVMAVDSSPFQLNIDLLNTELQGTVTVNKNVLLVGYQDKIDVYETTVTGSGPSFNYLYTIVSPINNIGSTSDIAYAGGYLYVSGKGLGTYRSIISPTYTWSAVGGVCDGQLVESLQYSGTESLMIVSYNPSPPDTYCIVDGSTGTQLISGSLPTQTSLYQLNNYTATAYNGSYVFLFTYNTSDNKPHIIGFDTTSSTWNDIIVFSAMKTNGMTSESSIIYLMVENGPLYRIDLTTKTITTVNTVLPFQPSGPGDRLEKISTYLVYVRDDGTSEAWVIST